MKFSKIVIVSILSLFAVGLLAGCSDEKNTADTKAQEATEKAMQESFSAVGMPGIKNWTEKKLMKWIYELRDQEKLPTFTYVTDMHGKHHYLGRSLGYGLPASVQYSNPERIWRNGKTGGGYYGGTIAQPEPNGLFMPEGLSATWVIMVNPKSNEPQPVYVEALITVSPFPLPTAEYGALTYEQVLKGDG